MNKAKLAETGIIVIIVVLISQLVNTIIGAVYGIYILVSTPVFPMGSGFVFPLLLPVVLYLSAIYILYSFRKRIAYWLAGEDDDSIVIRITPVYVVYLSIFIICFITLLDMLPGLLTQSAALDTLDTEQRILRGVQNPTGGMGGFFGMATSAIYIRLFLAVLLLAISGAKLFTGLRNEKEDEA